MNESTERPRRRAGTLDKKLERDADGASTARARKVVDERCAAIHRWIDDDDDPACRGID